MLLSLPTGDIKAVVNIQVFLWLFWAGTSTSEEALEDAACETRDGVSKGVIKMFYYRGDGSKGH